VKGKDILTANVNSFRTTVTYVSQYNLYTISPSETNILHVGFGVFMAVTRKNAVFWDVCFGRTCHLLLQGRKNNAGKEKC
jgi:hypothetical protein